MKFKISSTELFSHLQTISRVINSKNSLQILDNFLFNLEDNLLTLTASDIETTLVTSLEVQEVEGGGKVAVSNKLLLDTLREFTEQPLTFHIDDETLAMKVETDSGVFKFIGQNGDLYPKFPEISDVSKTLTVAGATLMSGINKTSFCMADDELRPVMNGIFFDVKEDLTLVATDAHKLVKFTSKYVSASLGNGEDEPMEFSFILPKKPALVLKNILTKETGNVEIKLDEKNAHFTLSNHTMVCRLIEGRFPNYNGVIPKMNPFKIIADRMTLLSASKRVSVFSNQASNLIKLDIGDNMIKVSAQDIDFSISAEDKVPCQYDSEPIKIGFKSNFFNEMLSNLESNDIIIELADPSRAGIIFPFEKDEDEEVLMLLMPMLLNE
jgi:DNA polymerase-3 subunit beta